MVDKQVTYTEGPWVAVEQRGKFDGNYNIQQAGRRGMLMSFVKIFGPNDLVHPDFAESAGANAHLISLAPELVEVLRELTDGTQRIIEGILGSNEATCHQWDFIQNNIGHEYEQARTLLGKLKL